MTSTEQILWTALRAFNRRGALHLTFSDGSRRTVGTGLPTADLRLVDAAAAPALIRGGTLGFAEAYIGGLVDTTDLRAFMRWGAANQARWVGTGVPILGPLRRTWQRVATTTRHEQVGTMLDHYNLGNEFYAAWLDDTMTYSSARFRRPGATLADAQTAKYEAIADHAGLRPGMRVLEIGCGWGGFAEYAAGTRDVHVTGVTIAEEQAIFARKRLADVGLTGTTDIRLEDFRDTAGQFDAVVSIEMIESVDESVWPDLFRAFHDRVRPGGRAVMQAITIRDDLFEGYRNRQDFIQRYIFPGGQCPSPAVIADLATAAGLEVSAMETFGTDYARTLEIWAARFERAWPTIDGLDQRFRRMWLLYLAYCEAGFRQRTIDVGQWVFEVTGPPR